MTRATDMEHLTKALRQEGKFRMAAINEMRRAVKSTLAECATMRGEAAREYRARTQKFLATLPRDLAAHRHATATQIAETQRCLAGMWRDVANEMAHFRAARNKVAKHTRSSLRRQVATVAKEAEHFLESAASAHHAMSKRQRSSLASSRQHLAKHTASFLHAAHADQERAHKIWNSFEVKGGATGR
jgi:hypothetical protein